MIHLGREQFELPRNVTFYLGIHHSDFKKKIRKELDGLESRNIEYVFFERSNRMMPRLCMDGYCVAGLNLIKKELNNILATPQ